MKQTLSYLQVGKYQSFIEIQQEKSFKVNFVMECE